MQAVKSITSIIFSICCGLFADAQNAPVPVGNWRIHLPYHDVRAIAETPEKIYCAARHGMFTLNKTDMSTERLSPINGFGGYKVQAIKYGEETQTLVIVYEDGKIELLRNNTITRNDDIYRKTIVGAKTIYHINIVKDIAYLSTSFGLMELDIVKNEMRNSYQYIGPNGTTIDVYSSSKDNDSIYISTSKGVMSGSTAEGVNLYFFSNWYLSKPASIGSRHIASFHQKLYAEIDSQLYVKENNTWKLFRNYQKLTVTNIDINHNELLIGLYGRHIYRIKEDHTIDSVTIGILNQCMLDGQGKVWYASPIAGLVVKDANNDVGFFPNGPRSNTSHQFINAYGNLWVMAGSISPGTYNPTFNWSRYYHFNNFEWTNSPVHPVLDPVFDMTVASYQKQNGRLYIGSHGAGLVQLNNGVPAKVFDKSNSRLQGRLGGYTYITGLATDSRNNLWVSNWDVDTSLFQISPNGTWTGYKLPYEIRQTGKILIDSRNNKWILTPKSNYGLIAFTDNNTPDKSDDTGVAFNTAKGTGNLPSTAVNDFAFTKSGELLVGTDQGYCKVRSPNNAFRTGNYDCERVIVSVEANSNLGGYLLGSEVIYCITVDGADRRWFGTNNGAWLIDSDGETILRHFTTDNSPLMSNNVHAIGIMESTGEVFFGTEQGIVSYRSDAMPPGKNIEKLTIFPNPVRPEFDGDIAITGLTDNSLVKITDINGALVYQTFSNGGMATWNCRTFDGTRPATGVYLAFCINPDGTETEVGKILFIR